MSNDDIDSRIINEIIWYPGDRVEINGNIGRIERVFPKMLQVKYDKPAGIRVGCFVRKDKPTRITEDYDAN